VLCFEDWGDLELSFLTLNKTYITVLPWDKNAMSRTSVLQVLTLWSLIGSIACFILAWANERLKWRSTTIYLRNKLHTISRTLYLYRKCL